MFFMDESVGKVFLDCEIGQPQICGFKLPGRATTDAPKDMTPT
jgi:hypothetical protein